MLEKEDRELALKIIEAMKKTDPNNKYNPVSDDADLHHPYNYFIYPKDTGDLIKIKTDIIPNIHKTIEYTSACIVIGDVDVFKFIYDGMPTIKRPGSKLRMCHFFSLPENCRKKIDLWCDEVMYVYELSQKKNKEHKESQLDIKEKKIQTVGDILSKINDEKKEDKI